MARGRPLLRAGRKTESHGGTFLPPSNADYIRDWTMLAPGERVFLVKNNAAELSGRVDTVTEDGSILWLHLEDGAGRRLFTHTDSVLTWRVSESRSNTA
jgi:hypothetical protein